MGKGSLVLVLGKQPSNLVRSKAAWLGSACCQLVGKLGDFWVKPPLLGFDDAIESKSGELTLLPNLGVSYGVQVALHLNK